MERAPWISSGVVKILWKWPGKCGGDYSTSQGMIYTVFCVLLHRGDRHTAFEAVFSFIVSARSRAGYILYALTTRRTASTKEMNNLENKQETKRYHRHISLISHYDYLQNSTALLPLKRSSTRRLFESPPPPLLLALPDSSDKAPEH